MKKSDGKKKLEKKEIIHNLTIPVTERHGALCLRFHMGKITVGKEKWNISNSGACLILEKEGDGLKDFVLSAVDMLKAIKERERTDG